MTFDKNDKKRGYVFLKRFLDIFFSSLLIIFLFIPMLLLGILVASTSKGGAVFKQRRVGKDGKVFICFKFRTMYEYAPSNRPTEGFYDADMYITPIGRFLRKSSLDELPQLFNVLMGDMSLVGPRPLIEEEEELHLLRRQCGVYSIRPGLTGLAQTSGRDLLSSAEKARLDAKYMRDMSLSRDTKIILKTFYDAFLGNGVIR